jgi:hypothetical protein
VSFFDRLFGASRDEGGPHPAPPRSDDARAVERYRYLLQTAPPEAIERVHREAFERLTPEQRALLLDELRKDAPAGEQPADDTPDPLARAATRAEMREPGSMERTMQAPVFGQVLGASLLGTVAGYVVGSALVSAFLPPIDAGGDVASDGGAFDASGDAGGDFGADFGGFGDFGF